MASFVKFRSYGSYGTEISIDVERVTHFYGISFNGNSGTELVLDTGAVVRVDDYTFDVEKKIAAAAAVKEQRA